MGLYIMSYELTCSYHCQSDVSELRKIVPVVTKVVKKILRKNKNIDHLVCTGISGQSITWPVANNIGIPVAVMRKAGEKAHTGDVKFIGFGEINQYIIIDDIIDSGKTIHCIFKELSNEECKAIILWNAYGYDIDHHFDYKNKKIPCYKIKQEWDV